MMASFSNTRAQAELSKRNWEPLLTSGAPDPRPGPLPCPHPHLLICVPCPLCLAVSPYLSWGLSLSLLQAGCLQRRLPNNRGADSEGVCRGHSGSFLEPYQNSEVTAQGSGWNFALDDLTRLAGASLGTAGVRPGRKQAPACWLLLLPPHPLSPGPDSRQTPAKRVHRGQRAAPSRDAYSSRAQGCVPRGGGGGAGRGIGGAGMTNVPPGANRALLRPPRRKSPGAEPEEGCSHPCPTRPPAGQHLPAHARARND